jgi:hypothetical protein
MAITGKEFRWPGLVYRPDRCDVNLLKNGGGLFARSTHRKTTKQKK